MRHIDPKYHIETDQAGEQSLSIVKTSNGQPIPDDEPLILFRARDRNALPMLKRYRELCEMDRLHGLPYARYRQPDSSL